MSDEHFVFGPFRLAVAQRMLLEDGEPLRLGSRALDILIALAERAGETVRKEDLIARVWPDTVVEEGALRVHVSALRKALGEGQSGRRYIANIPGRGYRLTAEVTHEEAAPALPTAPAVAGYLPAPLTRILGRADTVQSLAALLRQRSLLTIVGPGGIGKTTLAIAIGQNLGPAFRDGVWFAELASLPDPDLVPVALGTAIGISLPGSNPTSGLAAWLRDKEALIVLDSSERVIGAAAALAETLLRSAPRVRILATSREPLRAEGEWLHRLASLDMPPEAATLSVQGGLAYSAVELFNERASATLDGFHLTDADMPAVLEICRRLDGVPLALELAATRLDAFGVRELAAQLDRRFALLTKGRRTALPRQQTLRATMDWSYDLLPLSEQTVLRHLAVFEGNFTMERSRWAKGSPDSNDCSEPVSCRYCAGGRTGQTGGKRTYKTRARDGRLAPKSGCCGLVSATPKADI